MYVIAFGPNKTVKILVENDLFNEKVATTKLFDYCVTRCPT